MFEEVASHLISHLYADQIKENDLKPIIQPQVKFTSKDPSFDNDWEVEISSCELPILDMKMGIISFLLPNCSNTIFGNLL
jgi:hypothetical protein